MTAVGISPVLIVEPSVDGHRLMYVRVLAEGALRTGACVVLALAPGARSTPEYAIHLGALSADVTFMEISRADVASVARLSRDSAAGHVVVPDGDRFGVRLALGGRWRGSGDVCFLVMRSDPQPSPLSGPKFAVKQRLLDRAARMDRVRRVRLVSSLQRPDPGWDLAPDPVQLSATGHAVGELRERVGLTNDRYWFAVLGAIDERKNVPLVIDALLASGVGDIGLLLAGRIAPEVTTAVATGVAELRARGIQVVIEDAKLSDVEFDAAVMAVDCVVLAHSNSGPSGVLGKAAVAGTRAICAGAVALREDCQRIPDAATWVPLTLEALAPAMAEAAASPRPAPAMAADTARFCEALL